MIGSSRPRRASPNVRSASRRAAIQARSRSRGCTIAATRTAGLRVLSLEHAPEPETEILYEGKKVGRITSAAIADDGVLALAYVRREVPEDAELDVGHSRATQLH